MSPEALLREAIMRAKIVSHAKSIPITEIVKQEPCEIIPIKRPPPVPTKRDKIRKLAQEYRRVMAARKIYSNAPIIMRAVALYYNVTVNDFMAHRRTKAVLWPRHVAIYLVKELTLYSLPRIGTYFGNRDHTTILHAVNRVAQRCADDPEFRLEIGNIKALITRGVE